nr:putative zinc finger, CCHC-type [Tanacetum cinerariifolium]
MTLGSSVDTENSYEVSHNVYNKAHQRSIDHIDKSQYTYKARLVAKGYTQTPRIDYEETFSPVADIRAIRILIAIAVFYDYEIWQIDVKTAFLNGYLSEEVYMEQPEGFVNLKYPNRDTTSRFQQNPGDLHWTTVKNILKYLRNTKDMFFIYGGDIKRELRVSCYTDVGYLTDADDLKSQTEYVFVLNGANESEITKGVRHFRAEVHYLREVIEYGDVKLEKVHTYDNLADPFTKALAFPKHSEHTKNIGMLSASSLMTEPLQNIGAQCEANKKQGPGHKEKEGRSSYARAMIKLQADVKLKDNIVVAMPKLVGEGFCMCTIRVEYEWRPPRQATRGVLVGPKVSLKATKQVYRPISNKNGTSTGGKKVVLARQEVSSSNPFDVLNLIENDDDLGTNGWISKLAEMGSLNVVHDDDGNPLIHMSNVDSKSEVEVVFDETTNLMAPTSSKGGNEKCYGNNSLLEQWRETYRDDDYDPYDEDLY